MRAPAVSLLLALLTALTSCDRPAPHDDVPARTVESAPAEPRPDYGVVSVGPDLRSLVDRVVATGDHGQRSFAVIDKRRALVHVFDRDGRLMDSSPILLGQAIGDDSVPGIGSKAIADIRPEDRTTPAGRFTTMPGRNADGRPVVWIDYENAVSMHVVITETVSEHRLERLASADPARHRISWGCINLPAAFFSNVVQPAFAERGGIVYVLPETRSLAEVFPTLAIGAQAVVSAAPATDTMPVSR